MTKTQKADQEKKIHAVLYPKGGINDQSYLIRKVLSHTELLLLETSTRTVKERKIKL